MEDRRVKGCGEVLVKGLARVRSPNRGEGRGNRFLEGGPDAGLPSGAVGLIELELECGLPRSRL